MTQGVETPAARWQRARDWLAAARAKIAQSPLDGDDLAALDALLAHPPRLRQRLLYIHTGLPTPTAPTRAIHFVEPVPGGGEVDVREGYRFPYESPHAAVLDGWQIVKFPEYRYPIQDREIDVQGYQFVLQKWEIAND